MKIKTTQKSLKFFGYLIFLNSIYAQQSTTQESVQDQTAKSDAKVPLSEPTPTPQEAEKKDQFNLTYYEPMYFLAGNPTSKVNFSFKYQFLRDFPLYMGYVQHVFWLLKQESKPFRDANFNPRIFYRLSLDKKDGSDFIDFIAYEHKSNGKSEPESRSYDASGAKISIRAEYENWSLKSYVKGLWRYNYDETNSNFDDYVGPFEVGITFSQFSFDVLDRAEISYRFYTGGDWGEDFRRQSHEVGISFRLFGRTLTPSIYIQYFNGYSESLLNYDKREENLRVGLML